MRNTKTLFITEVAILSALAVVLDLVCGTLFSFSWTSGGSVSIAMFPIFILGIRWGLPGGFAGGLILGLIQLILPTSFVAGIFQAAFDYIFAFGILGIVGLIKPLLPKLNNNQRYIVSTLLMIVAGILRTLFHIFSGVLFFNINFIGSTLYNLPYMIPSIIASILFVIFFMYKTPNLVYLDN